MLVLRFSLPSVFIRTSCNKNKLHNLCQCHDAAMNSYQTSYLERNEDFEIQTQFLETQNFLIDNRAFLVMNNNLKQTKHFHYLHHNLQLYRISLEYFSTSSAPLLTVFAGLSKNDKIDLKDMTTLLSSNSCLALVIKLCFDKIFNLIYLLSA